MTDRDVHPVAGPDDALSALMDGEANEASLERLCTGWHHDPGLRTDWHTYHLIGDVLRSAELARPGADDERFLQSLRQRLLSEPAPTAAALPDMTPALTPPSTPQGKVRALPSKRRPFSRRWAAPIGIAAGIVMVTAVVLVTRTGEPTQAASLASSRDAVSGAERTRRVEHDTQLERYVNEHRQFQSSFSPATPFLRSATFDAGEQ